MRRGVTWVVSAFVVVAAPVQASEDHLPALDAHKPQVLSGTYAGEFSPFAEAAEQDRSIAGKVILETDAHGAKFRLRIKGLKPDLKYVSHVHRLACSDANADGHYKFDVTQADNIEANEIWFAIASNKKKLTIDHDVPRALRIDAKSVVIHRMVGEKMLKVSCADLKAR